jgi:DNA-binding beta-propeller fold protein YncE
VKALARVLAAAVVLALLASCNNDTKPNPTCPLIGDRGPALASRAVYLLTANSLAETWTATPLSGGAQLVTLPRHGLTGRAPNDVDVVGSRLYIVNSLDNDVSVVNLETGETVGCIDLGTGVNPWEFTPEPADTTRGWITSFVSGEVMELDLAAMKVLRRDTVGVGAEGLAVTSNRVWVTLSGYDGAEGKFKDGTVVVLNKSDLSEAARLAVPPNPQFLFTGADGRMQVICTGNFDDVSGEVVRIEADASAVRDTLALGGSPYRAAVAPGGVAYVAGYYGGVTSYDTGSFVVLHDVNDPVLPEPSYSDVAVFDTRLYAANFDFDGVVVVDLSTLTKIGEFATGDGPSAVAVRAFPGAIK